MKFQRMDIHQQTDPNDYITKSEGDYNYTLVFYFNILDRHEDDPSFQYSKLTLVRLSKEELDIYLDEFKRTGAFIWNHPVNPTDDDVKDARFFLDSPPVVKVARKVEYVAVYKNEYTLHYTKHDPYRIEKKD